VSRRLPIGGLMVAGLAAIALGAIAAGRHPAPPEIDGLLVAAGGPLLVTDGSGALVDFDGPSDPIVAVAASSGRAVAAVGGGTFLASDGSSTPRRWTVVAVPTRKAIVVPLLALSPRGKELIVAAGEPAGTTFELVILDLASGAARSVSVQRGLNGPPSWIGPTMIAVDVIKPNGESGIAAIDALTGALTDDVFSGTSVSASDDRRHVALDDPATGDVLVGDLDERVLGAPQRATRLGGPAGSAVEALGMSGDGSRLAVVRRSEEGISSVEIYALVIDRWARARTIKLAGDGRVSVAWLR
jgi:hypothetical protein